MNKNIVTSEQAKIRFSKEARQWRELPHQPVVLPTTETVIESVKAVLTDKPQDFLGISNAATRTQGHSFDEIKEALHSLEISSEISVTKACGSGFENIAKFYTLK